MFHPRHHAALAAGSTHRLFLPSLDGARGLAVLFVLLDHFSSAKVIDAPALNGLGHVGVYLFFSLSAFLLTLPFCLNKTEELMSWQTWATYFSRRLLRIYPLYALLLLVKWGSTVLTSGHLAKPSEVFSLRSVGNHLLLRQGDGVLWTMPVETKYYLLLPLLVLLCILPARRHLLFGILGAALLARFVVPLFFFIETDLWALDDHILKHYLLIFVLGSATAVIHSLTIEHPPSMRFGRYAFEFGALGVLVLLLCLFPPFSGLLPQALVAKVLNSKRVIAPFFGCLWGVFIYAHLHGQGWIKAVLEWRPLRYLGLISYSVYLWHKPVMAVIWFCHLHLPKSVHIMTEFGAILAAGSLSFFLIERPLSRLNARFTRSL